MHGYEYCKNEKFCQLMQLYQEQINSLLYNKHHKLCFLERYKVPTLDFQIFLHNLDSIMTYCYTPKIEFVI
jgi:hypothetical protein